MRQTIEIEIKDLIQARNLDLKNFRNLSILRVIKNILKFNRFVSCPLEFY